jgi:NAD(P)-dependent dehydrogenase (short-subunit alcohol dehydrogenase family)
MKDPRRKTAVVTGAGSGLGMAISASLLQESIDVFAIDINKDNLESSLQLLSNIPRNGAKLTPILADAFEEADVLKIVDQVGSDLDVVVSTVGTGSCAPILEQAKSDFEKIVLGNLMPAVLLLKHTAKSMAKNGSGSFIAVSSINAIFPESLLAAYSCGKAALDAFVRAAARELGSLGIRVNSVRPGLTETPGASALFNIPGYKDAYVHQQSLKRIAHPNDIANVVRFLAGGGSNWITGQNINVDGGLSINAIPKKNGKSFFAYTESNDWLEYMG